MSRRKMPANVKAERGSTSLLYDNNNNAIIDHNNNHVTNSSNNNNLIFNNQDSESNERSNTSSPNIKKELNDFNDLNDADQNSNNSQCNDDIINDDEQLNDDLELDEDNSTVTSNNNSLLTNNKTSRSLLCNKLTNGALQSSPLNMCFSNELNQQTKLLNQHLTNLVKNNKSLLNKATNKNVDSETLFDSLNNLTNLTGLNSLNSLNSLNNLANLNNFNNLNSLNSGLNSLTNLANLNQNSDDNCGVLINANDEDDEDSSNMVITPDIGDYASYHDDLDEPQGLNLKSNLNTIDDDDDEENDLLNDNKDDREGCRSLICDSNGIIIAEMVYRCMVCANISDSITDAQRHYQLKHILCNQGLGGLNSNNSPLNNYSWKTTNHSANSSRSSNSSLVAQKMKTKELQLKKQKQLHRMQQIKIEQQKLHQLQRFQQHQAKLKEQQKLQQQKSNQQRLIQQMQQNQLQIQQNQRLEQLRQQQLNELAQIQQLQQQQQQQQQHQQQQQLQHQSNESSPQLQSVSNSVQDLNSLFLNPPLPGTVAKTPQTSNGSSSRGGYVTCAVCSITKFYASVQRRYGQFTCMGCAKFFGRFLAKPKKFNCPNLGSCALNTSPRCKACLLLACINTYTIDEKRKMVVNANRPVQRPGPSGLIGRASDNPTAKRKSAKVSSAS